MQDAAARRTRAVSARSPRLVVLGLSHRTAPVGLREKAALDEQRVRALLRTLISAPGIAEAAAVSTCNRTEVYVVCEEAEAGRAAAARALVECSRISRSELACAGYALYDEEAAGHLFRVAGGLDSMVLGESEVQGQVRAAAERAAEEETLGVLLGGLFRQALAAGRRVRRETRIASGATSVSSAAVEIARRALPDLAERRILLIGAGRIAESTGRALSRHGARGIAVANRTVSAARSLAARLGGRAVDLGTLADELRRADIVVSSTDAPHPIVRRADVERALAARPERPLVLIDLAVPRDVEPGVAGMPGALLYDIDDLEGTMRASLEGRRRELARATAIVAEEVARFRVRRNALAVAPTVEALYTRAEEIRRAELARMGRELGPAELERVDALTRSLVTRLLHEPAARLRGAGSLRHADSVRHLFALEEGDGEAIEMRVAGQVHP